MDICFDPFCAETDVDGPFDILLFVLPRHFSGRDVERLSRGLKVVHLNIVKWLSVLHVGLLCKVDDWAMHLEKHSLGAHVSCSPWHAAT